jgi:tetratricopeptide (TPR) repeat protein
MLDFRKMFVFRRAAGPAVRALPRGTVPPAPPWRLAILTVLALAGADACEPGLPGSGLSGSGVPVSPLPPLPPDRRLAELHVSLDPPAARFRWEAESIGLGAALVEQGLTDFAGIVPVMGESPPSPGLSARLEVGVERWTGTFSVRPIARGSSELVYRLDLCGPGARCQAHEARGTREAPHRATSRILQDAALQLGQPWRAGLMESWDLPVSGDPYAVLLCGRSAATWYGLLPGRTVPSGVPSRDRRNDAVARAVFLDPRMPPALWFEGRRRFASGEPRKALVSFTRASLERKDSLVFLADQAASLLALGQPEAAIAVWNEIDAADPGDARFSLARVEAALAGHRPLDAKHVLDRLPARFQADPKVAALRVAAADVMNAQEDLATLLQRWQELSPTDPEPVRRRIGLLVEGRRIEDARALTEELAHRGAEGEASAMALALAASLDDWDVAIAEAESLGLRELALKLRARRSFEATPTRVPDTLATLEDSPSKLVKGQARLFGGEAGEALVEADEVLTRDPWNVDALALRALALEALERTDERDETLLKLARADPRR